MSEELKLKPCPRCWKNVSIIHAHGCKFIRCDCGIQSSRYGEHIADRHMVADWNRRPVEDSHAVRIAELEKFIKGILATMQESTGIAGYHLNGDIATWDELGLIEEATELLEVESGYTMSMSGKRIRDRIK